MDIFGGKGINYIRVIIENKKVSVGIRTTDSRCMGRALYHKELAANCVVSLYHVRNLGICGM